jgi:hypothetical protein
MTQGHDSKLMLIDCLRIRIRHVLVDSAIDDRSYAEVELAGSYVRYVCLTGFYPIPEKSIILSCGFGIQRRNLLYMDKDST